MSCSLLTNNKTEIRCSHNDQHCGCHNSPCHHGTCFTQKREGYHSMFCNCYQGFTGYLCDKHMNTICPCLNGGTCLADHSGCLCSNGYHGDYCQIVSDYTIC